MKRMKKKRSSVNKSHKNSSNIDSKLSALNLEPVKRVASSATEAAGASSLDGNIGNGAPEPPEDASNHPASHVTKKMESSLGKPVTANLDQKSEEKANKLREEGNLHFKRNEKEKALTLYTQSIAFAPPNSRALAFAFSNRAVVLRDIGQYADSIVESQRALEAGYPDLNSHVLYFRQGFCYKKLGQDGRAKKCFNIALKNVENKSTLSEIDKVGNKEWITAELKLCKAVDEEEFEDLTRDKSIGVLNFEVPSLRSKKVNPEIPSASDCIALKYNETFGRHLVAARDINPGEVLIVEEPFAAVLETSLSFSHCSHCFKLCHTLLPCRDCTWAMFCSEACIEESHSYHQLECAVMPGFLQVEDLNSSHLAARVVTSAGYDNLQSFFEQQRNKKETILTEEQKRTAGFNKDGKFISSDINTIANLCPNKSYSSKKASEALNKMAVEVMKNFGFDKLPFASDLLGFVFKFITSISNNCNSVTEFHKDRHHFSGDIKRLGSSIYPTFSLMNHSCHTNIFYNFYGKTCVVRSAQFIKKGSLLVTNSGKSFMWFPKRDRQLNTLRSLGFICKCEACEGNWPEHDDLPIAPFYCYSEEKAKSVKVMASISVLLEKAIGDPQVGWRVEKRNLPLFLKHIMLLQSQGKFLNLQFFIMQECIRTYYNMQGNHVGNVGDDDDLLIRHVGARFEN